MRSKTKHRSEWLFFYKNEYNLMIKNLLMGGKCYPNCPVPDWWSSPHFSSGESSSVFGYGAHVYTPSFPVQCSVHREWRMLSHGVGCATSRLHAWVACVTHCIQNKHTFYFGEKLWFNWGLFYTVPCSIMKGKVAGKHADARSAIICWCQELNQAEQNWICSA